MARRVPHVFQAYYPILDEAAAALDRAGQFLSAHLAGAERVTGRAKGRTQAVLISQRSRVQIPPPLPRDEPHKRLVAFLALVPTRRAS
jgi:hypothetical protein